MLRSWRKWKCILCHTRDVDLFSTLMSSPPFRLNYDGVGGVTRKRCNPFHYSARTVSQCRTGNRRRRTVPATEPNRAAVEIALPCTCATERRAADAILSTSSRPHAENIVRSNIVTVRMAAHAGPRIELCVCRIIMIAIPTFLRSPRGFICEWMRERFFVFGSPHVILLPTLCYYLRFPLFEP